MSFLDERGREAARARNLRREADVLGRRYWQARADHSLTPAECERLEAARWLAIQAASRIERHLRGLPSG